MAYRREPRLTPRDRDESKSLRATGRLLARAKPDDDPSSGLGTIAGIAAGVVFAVAVVALGLPMAREDAGGPCAAVELQAARTVAAGERPGNDRDAMSVILGGAAALSGGQLAAELARTQYPSLPPAMACAAVYWRSMAGR